MDLFGLTDKGRARQNNEDAFFTSQGPVGIFDCLMIVCDGMGGHSYGEIASGTCVSELVLYVRNAAVDNPAHILYEACCRANLAVLKESEERGNLEMGTTLVMAGVIGKHVYIVNIGDSRLYLVDSGRFRIRQITKDHSFVEEQVEKGLMKRDSDEYRMQKNVITRAVGVYSEVEADEFELELSEGQYLLLCSDGLTNMVSDKVIKNLVLDDSFTLERRAETLVNEANRNGGKDNITVILYRYSEGEA